jgi:hypothetical protein
MEIIGVCGECFLLRLWPEDRIIKRSYHDLFHLSKQIQLKQLQFPATQLKNLISSGDWDREHHWNPNKTKTLSRSNQWLEQILQLKPIECQQFSNEIIFEKQLLLQKERKVLESEARRLQQYFMSRENVEFLIQKTLEFHEEGCLYLEPSCGDGRLLQALFEQEKMMRGMVNEDELEEKEEKKNDEKGRKEMTLWGCDIDPKNIMSSGSGVGDGQKYHLHLGNYLETTPESFGFFSTLPSRVIIFGGPPYTCGGGTGLLTQSGDSTHDTGRDLPFQFIVHSAVTLSAHAIIFLLPTRCQHTDFIQRCQVMIQGESTRDSAKEEMVSALVTQPSSAEIDSEQLHKRLKMTITAEMADFGSGIDEKSEFQEAGKRFKWTVSNFHPPNNEFDFCGRVIRQPVIVQVWERSR